MVEAIEQNPRQEADTGYFKPQKKLGILIGISDYSQINQERFGDLPNVLQNIETVKTGLKEFGFKQEEITAKTEAAEYSQIDKIFRDARAEVKANNERGEKTLAYVYFAGHGVMHDGMTHAVCGKIAANQPNQWVYKIEDKIQKLAKEKGVYVVSLLDCGRGPLEINDSERA